MKKLVLLLLFVAGGVFAQTDVVKFKAKIANRNSDSLLVLGPKNFKKVMRISKDGTFSDSFTVVDGPHALYDGVEQTSVYLKNGYDLSLTMDAKEFDETIVYTGTGSKENNFIAQKALADEKFEEKMATFADEKSFEAALAERNAGLEKQLADPGLDANFKMMSQKMAIMELQGMSQMYKMQMAQKKLTGSLSPQFDYENHKGGKTKLADFKGKYVYIDNWATWCGPCRAEIPFLKKIEERYHGKNIEFVSISIDEQKDHEKWQKFVIEKKLGGTQLFADNAWQSKFIQDFGIDSIPRFILIAPDGTVVDANAKRPSEKELTAQLDALLR